MSLIFLVSHFHRCRGQLWNQIFCYGTATPVRRWDYGAWPGVYGQIRAAATVAAVESPWLLYPRMHQGGKYDFFFVPDLTKIFKS